MDLKRLVLQVCWAFVVSRDESIGRFAGHLNSDEGTGSISVLSKSKVSAIDWANSNLLTRVAPQR